MSIKVLIADDHEVVRLGIKSLLADTEIEIVADVSMDQILAKHLAGETQVPSLELSMDAPANAGMYRPIAIELPPLNASARCATRS